MAAQAQTLTTKLMKHTGGGTWLLERQARHSLEDPRASERLRVLPWHKRAAATLTDSPGPRTLLGQTGMGPVFGQVEPARPAQAALLSPWVLAGMAQREGIHSELAGSSNKAQPGLVESHTADGAGPVLSHPSNRPRLTP